MPASPAATLPGRVLMPATGRPVSREHRLHLLGRHLVGAWNSTASKPAALARRTPSVSGRPFHRKPRLAESLKHRPLREASAPRYHASASRAIVAASGQRAVAAAR